MPVNKFGRQILSKKYYGPGEAEPEHLFRRVAKVCSIPDVIDYLLATTKDLNNLFEPAILLEQIFHEFSGLALRVLQRRSPFCRVDESIRFSVDLDNALSVWAKSGEEYFNMMNNLDFMPGTPTLMNAGRGGMLSSCFAIRVPDSMEGIFDVVKEVALISKAGGGVGLDLSLLRGRGDPVGSTGGVSSGVISFMRVFNEAGNQVKQGGFRRAALLCGLRVDHPDIIEFIKCKDKEGELSNFNISVFVTDSFMDSVKNDELINLWHEKSAGTRIPARKIWDTLVEHATHNGEPGIIFQGRLNEGDITCGKYSDLLVNPCAELVLHNYSSCNLGSINLSNFYDEKINTVDLEKLENSVRLGVRFLDNVIDLNKYPLDKIEEITLKLRPIGLGTMGLHDLMLKSSIEYGSKTSLGLIDAIYSTIKRIAIDESTILGRLRGIPEDLKEFNVDRRNGSLLTVPPTGTVSQIANCSSGIEPNFAWEYTRKDSYGEHKVKHFILDKYGDGPLPNYAKTALEINPEAHVLVQAQIQKFVDSSISKTVNLPFEATKEDVDRIYKLAFDSGCKSITVYRSGSRTEEVLTPKKSVANNNSVQQEQKVETMEKLQKDISTEDPQSRPRERVLFGATFSVNTPSGKCYVTINEDDSGIREVFINIAKAGSDLVAYTESLGRLISSMLKFKLPIQTIISQLEGQKSSPTWDHGRSIKSVPDAVAKLLQEYRDNLEGFSLYIDDPLENNVNDNNVYRDVVVADKKDIILSGEFCVDCGEMLRREGGCEVCKNCGYSKCS